LCIQLPLFLVFFFQTFAQSVFFSLDVTSGVSASIEGVNRLCARDLVCFGKSSFPVMVDISGVLNSLAPILFFVDVFGSRAVFPSRLFRWVFISGFASC
jgi:hypothetical protein